jgi:hypothetical protein
VRHYRRNADEGRRQIERRIAQGDHDARAELFIHDLRMGKPVELAAAEVLAGMEIRELQQLPGPLLESIRDSSVVATHTKLWGSDGHRGGWFPNHHDQARCPRGHSVETGSGFEYAELRLHYRSIFGVREDEEDGETHQVVEVGGVRDESDGSDSEWIVCRTCFAAWDVGETDWV